MGLVLGILLGKGFDWSYYIFAIAAGIFLYVALADMVRTYLFLVINTLMCRNFVLQTDLILGSRGFPGDRRSQPCITKKGMADFIDASPWGSGGNNYSIRTGEVHAGVDAIRISYKHFNVNADSYLLNGF